MVGAAMRYPASYKQLMGAGYAEAQIPAWINRPDSHLPPEEPPDAALDAGEGLQVPVPDLQVPEGAVEVPVELPTLADLEVTVETPAHRAVELQAPQVPAGKQVPAGGEAPPGKGEELKPGIQAGPSP